MKFSEALQAAIDTGIGIYRPSWNGNAARAEGVAQFVEVGRENSSYLSNPYLVISQQNGRSVWVPSTGDLFAEDWETL